MVNALVVRRNTQLAKAEKALRAAQYVRMSTELQERLINWGYAVSDAALRKHVDPALAAPGGFPYPDAGV